MCRFVLACTWGRRERGNESNQALLASFIKLGRQLENVNSQKGDTMRAHPQSSNYMYTLLAGN